MDMQRGGLSADISIRAASWVGLPKRTLHAGIWYADTTPVTAFQWMKPPVTSTTPRRVTPKYKAEYVGNTGPNYKHYVAMRLNTTETVESVGVGGTFTADYE